MDAEQLVFDVREYWRPPAKLSLSEWADRYAVLSSESSADGGKWHTLPYQRGMMNAVTDPRIESVTIMKSARVGYTKMLNHVVGYYMHQDPCPIMIVQPTLDDAEGYSKDEIAPMLRDTPVLAGLVSDPKSRDSGNTMLLKSFPGGVVQLVGANSPRGFRRVTRRIVAFDETDGYPQSAGPEGDQLKLGIMRTLTFWNRKIIAGSTPTLEATSRIARRFEKSDQRYYHVPCPDCGGWQVLKMANLRWEKNKPESVLYHCEHCGVGIGHHRKRWMIDEADRQQREGNPLAGWIATHPEIERHAGFHIWAGYSYAPNATWAHLASEWEGCQDNIEELKTFINTVLGETWKGKGDAPEWQRLYDRREQYLPNTLPNRPVMIFAGADVQKDRIEVEIVAYSARLESWSIDYRVFPGDTANVEAADSPWRGLESLLAESWLHDNGSLATLRMLAVDAGYNTQSVLSWVRKWPSSRVIAVFGVETLAVPIGQPRASDVTTGGKRKSRGAKQWPVGTNLLTTELYGFLKQDRPTEESGLEYPHGYCHFPEYPEEFFRQMTAEEMVTRLVRGYRRHQFEKVRDRNETLDCRKYARAASILCGVDRISADQWAQMAVDVGLIEQPQAEPDAPKVEVVNGVEVTRRKSNYWQGRGR